VTAAAGFVSVSQCHSSIVSVLHCLNHRRNISVLGSGAQLWICNMLPQHEVIIYVDVFRLDSGVSAWSKVRIKVALKCN
jgi:hypothetical protein